MTAPVSKSTPKPIRLFWQVFGSGALIMVTLGNLYGCSQTRADAEWRGEVAQLNTQLARTQAATVLAQQKTTALTSEVARLKALLTSSQDEARRSLTAAEAQARRARSAQAGAESKLARSQAALDAARADASAVSAKAAADARLLEGDVAGDFPVTPQTPVGATTISGRGYVGCTERDMLNRLVRLSVQGDGQAVQRLFDEQNVQGVCTLFSQGEQVFVMGQGFGEVRVRRTGQSDEFWTLREALN